MTKRSSIDSIEFGKRSHGFESHQARILFDRIVIVIGSLQCNKELLLFSSKPRFTAHCQRQLMSSKASEVKTAFFDDLRFNLAPTLGSFRNLPTGTLARGT